MNLIRLIYLRWRVGFLSAQWEHSAQLATTYEAEAQNLYHEIQRVRRRIFMLTPPKEITR